MKKKKPHTSRSCNFRLTGNTSIFIGIYIILGTLLLNSLITTLSTEDTWLSFLPKESIKFYVVGVIVFILLLSLLTLYLKAKENVNELGFILWNKTSKKSVWQIVVLLVFGFILSNKLLELGYDKLIIPVFLLCYGILISMLNYTKYQSLYRFAILCSTLGIIAYFIPSYWVVILIILGVNHIIHGIVYRD